METEWKNGDKPPPKSWKMVVFNVDGTHRVDTLGNGRRENGGQWGKMEGNREKWGRTRQKLAPFPPILPHIFLGIYCRLCWE